MRLISDERLMSIDKYRHIQVGDVFKMMGNVDGKTYLKVDRTSEGHGDDVIRKSAFCLQTNKLVEIDSSQECIVCDAEVVITFRKYNASEEFNNSEAYSEE